MKLSWKRIFFGVITCIVLIGITLFFHGGTANAQDLPGWVNPFITADSSPTAGWVAKGTTDDLATDKTQAELWKFFEMILKVLYLILRPLLAIAGASLDNTLVYGTIFYLDKALWEFWQMIRTFANFWLGFIFIASIFVSFVGGWGEKLKKIDVKTIIKKLFLAGILINMSRFIVAALLDLSTIMVFNLGVLPLHVIRQDVKDEQWLGKARYLTTHSFYNQDSSRNKDRDQVEHSVVYSCPGPDAQSNAPKTYYLPCWIEEWKFAPKGAQDENNTWDRYQQQYADAREGIWDWEVWENIDENFCVRWYDLITNKFGEEFKPEDMKALREEWLVQLKANECSTLDTLIEKAQGMTWPMYTLYGTILHMGEVGLTINNKTVVEAWLEFLMRVIVALALFLPLVALAVVLVMRAVILRLVIAFSPLLALVYVFGFKVGGDKAELKSVLWLIFLPVFAVFAVSISILFLSLIWRIELIDDTDTCKEDAFSRLSGAELSCPNKDNSQRCYKLFNITDICFTESQRTTWSNIINTLTWLTVNFFGIALMRTIIFFVLKSNKITGSIAGKIESFGKWLASSASIIPLPTGGFTSLGALNQAATNIKGVPDRLAAQQFNQGLWEQIESRGAQKDAKKHEKDLAGKLDQAAQGTQPTFTPSSDFTLPDNTNHTQYKSLGPSLWMASRKSYADAKSMSFKDAYSDPQTIDYMQTNKIYNTRNWVTNDGNMWINERLKLARSMEDQLASQWVSLGKDSAHKDSTRFVLGNYVTQFPRWNSTKGILNGDMENRNVTLTPTKKEHWDKFAKFFMDSAIGIRNNTEFANAFPEYMGRINLAAAGGTATFIDKETDPSKPAKTYTITVNKDSTNNSITWFQLK